MLQKMYDANKYIPVICKEDYDTAYEQKDYLNISQNEKQMLENWIKFDGCFYFLKHASNLNELIGEAIAKKIKLRTAHYMPVLKDGFVLLASRNFRKMNCRYLNVDELKSTMKINDILDNPKYDMIQEQLFKLFSLDIYMRQTDRTIPNLLFEIDTKDNLLLAPTFDYSNAFYNLEYKKYNNPILEICMDKKTIDMIMNKYPDLYKYIKNISLLDLQQILVDICDEHDLKLLGSVKDYYLMEDEKSKKMLKKILY